MRAEEIIGISIYLFVALIMFVIGFLQYKSIKPVSFYTNEEPLPSEKYLDVKKWNHCHGLMFIIYGFIIVVGCLIGTLITQYNSVTGAIINIAFVLIPLPIIIIIHEKLKKKYIKK